MKIPVVYIDTADPDYRDWQLDPDQPYLICIDCHRLVKRWSPLQHRCKKCHAKKHTPKRLRMRRIAHKRWKLRAGPGWKTIRKHWLEKHPICVRCGTRENLTVDHIKPLSEGGRTEPNNLQTLCFACHTAKTRADERYYHELHRRLENDRLQQSLVARWKNIWN